MEKKSTSFRKNFPPLSWRLGLIVASLHVSFLLNFIFGADKFFVLRSFALYIATVVLFDAITFRFFEGRAYKDLNPRKIRKQLKVSLPNLKRYFRSRLCFRILGILFATIGLLLTKSLGVFVSIYSLMNTVMCIAYYFDKPEVRPRLLKVANNYPYVPGRPVCGVTPEVWAANKLAGIPSPPIGF